MADVDCEACGHFRKYIDVYRNGAMRDGKGFCTLNPTWVEVGIGHFCSQWDFDDIGVQGARPGPGRLTEQPSNKVV